MSGVPVIVADAVISLGVQDVTRRRWAAGAISTTSGSKGVFTNSTYTDTPIAASMGPLSGRQRSMLPEGIRLTARYMMHTIEDVQGDQPTTTSSMQQGDQIIYQGRVYQVFEDRRWTGHGLYRRFILFSQTVEP
jgi:hypothetical protein